METGGVELWIDNKLFHATTDNPRVRSEVVDILDVKYKLECVFVSTKNQKQKKIACESLI